MPNESSRALPAEQPARDFERGGAAERALRRASLAGFEERLQRCRRELWAFFDEHRGELRCPSEVAFLLGQMHAMIQHCRDLEDRYRLERVLSEARDATAVPAGSAKAPGPSPAA